MDSFTPMPLYYPGKEPPVPIGYEAGGPQSQSVRYGEYNICLPPIFMLVSCLAYSSTLKIETCSSETSVYFQRTARRYIPSDGTLKKKKKLIPLPEIEPRPSSSSLQQQLQRIEEMAAKGK
jgi:hypothetical protein